MTQELIGGTIAMLGLAGSVIGIWIKANEKILLANQRNKYTQIQLDKLEIRVGELENNIYAKLDTILTEINNIKITVVKLS